MSGPEIVVRAKWILPVDRAPIDGGRIVLRAGRIVAVDSECHQTGDRDLENAIVFPRFINAHTHLEFSNLTQPLGPPHSSFATWVGRVVESRRCVTTEELLMRKKLAIQSGLRESRAAAVGFLGEICSPPSPPEEYRATAPMCVTFHERLGLDPAAIATTIEEVGRTIAQQVATEPTARMGISPHAPYSTHVELVKGLCLLANRHQIPIAMHLAESREELELLSTGNGPLRKVLESLSVWRSDAIPRGCKILDYLKRLAGCVRSLIIHGNYLSETDLDFVASQRRQMFQVFCPRTHSFFGHDPYPLPDVLRRGIRLAIGTDSRASNPDLSLARDVAHAAHMFPEINPEQFLRMVTIHPALALGVDDVCGTITPGKSAQLAIIRLPGDLVGDPLRLWLENIEQSSPLEIESP